MPENIRPPRYRLLRAAAALELREAVVSSESFEGGCPACGRIVVFTQIQSDSGVELTIEEHYGCEQRDVAAG